MRIVLTLATLLSLAPAALADTKAPAKPAPTPVAAAPAPAPAATPAVAPASGERVSDDCSKARKQNKTCVLDMGGESIDGTLVKNTGLDVNIATFGPHGSLIHIRKDFIAEIVKTAEDL